MTADDWASAHDPLDMLQALMESDLAHAGRMWNYVVLCLEGIGETATAALLTRVMAHHATDAEVAACRADLERRARRRAGGAYSQGRKPVHLPPGAQRARAGLAVFAHSGAEAFEGVTRATQHVLQRQQCAWLRCLFPNPLRAAGVEPARLTPTVADLARAIEADRAFDRLPIHADALQESGCGDEDLLTHLRSGEPHLRGCWALDLTLGRA